MKRVKVTPKCPNPLFVSWLEAWKEDAKSRNSEMQYCFGKALNSLKKFPVLLNSGRACRILEGFGPKLCAMLDKKLEDYKAANGNNFHTLEDPFFIEDNNPISSINKQQKDKESTEIISAGKRTKKNDNKEDTAKKKKNSNTKEDREDGRQIVPRNTGAYIPAWRSGGYAILLTLYHKSLEPDYIGYMNKADLQADAQKHSDTSLKKPDPGNRYTAWSSITTLIQKGLVIRKSSPAKYSLTDAGLALAMQLSEVEENDSALESSSQCGSSGQSSETSTRSKVSHQAEYSRSKDEENEILPLNNVSNIRNEKKRQKVIENHSQIVDIYQRTNSQHSASSGDDVTVIFRPKTFDIILIVDDRETAGKKTRPKDDMTIAELTQSGIKFEIRNLKIGDFTWIARCRDSGEELILPHIVERKRMDDFGGSIKDGRYHEQKFRLKKSGIQNITYLIENHGNNQFTGLPLQTLFQAATNTLVQDGFNVKYTDSHRESMFYLASITEMLTRIYREKTLVGCKKEDLTTANTVNDVIQLMVFKDFNKAAAKVKTFKAKEMFIRHLVQLKGISIEKAIAIVDFYPTPTALKKAFDNCGSGAENLLSGIQFGSSKRQLGPAISKTLYQFYTKKDF